ncbi:hypothetical protein PV783_34355, partial [Chitinophaga sp. CC14]|uniref:hypothetical protein n=1 Tax=Chitinophaga sp. CC14 TaxID=3029199 RepID=UPI003B7EA42C
MSRRENFTAPVRTRAHTRAHTHVTYAQRMPIGNDLVLVGASMSAQHNAPNNGRKGNKEGREKVGGRVAG